MKMLMFDFRETEKEFFENNDLVDFDLRFIIVFIHINVVTYKTNEKEY